MSTGLTNTDAAGAPEELIASVVAEVLGLPRIGREDDFFALASLPRRLLATRLASRLREALHLEVPLAALLANPTVAGLAARIAASRSVSAVPPIERAAERREFPLSFSQQGLWFLDQLEPGSAAYNVPLVLELEGDLAAAALDASLRTIERRHEALRTRFGARAGQPFQRVAPCGDAPLPVIDLTSLPRGRRAKLAMRLAEEESRHPFDLATGPLWRPRLLRLDEAQHWLVLALHHIVCDGWSIEILLRELGVHYVAFAAEGAGVTLPALPVQYGDYALWQHRHCRREAMADPLDAWKRRLAGHLSALELAVDRPHPASHGAGGGTISTRLPTRPSNRVREWSRGEGATPFMVLLAVFEILLSRYTGRREFVVGTPVANRTRTELKDLIGFFANTLVLPAEVVPEASFRELVARVREVAVAAIKYQDLPLEMLVQDLAPDRGLPQLSIFQAFFAYHSAPTALPAMPGLSLRVVEVDCGVAKFDLSLGAIEAEAGLRVLLEYRPELFSRAAASRLLGHFTTLLEGAVTNPDQRVDSLPLLTEAERHQLLISCNDTAVDAVQKVELHHLFVAQARRTPHALAVVCGEAQVTYAELDLRSQRLAHRLRDLGVAAEVPVGICLERTVEMVVAVLAVLRAGGAYLPLDPTHPGARLVAIVEAARAPVVLTRERLLDKLSGVAARRLCLDDECSAQDQDSPTGEELPAPCSERLAYVLYTSGSTGMPKGVAIEHRSPVALVSWARQAFSAAELRGVLAATSLSFDLSVFELFVPLSCGGTVILADNALSLPTLPAREEVTLVNTVPSVLAELLRCEGIPGSVRTVNLAGEPLPGHLVRQLYETGRVSRVFNLYGPTEDTTYSTAALLTPGSEAAPAIGRPLLNREVYLLDGSFEPVPPGVAAELYLGGTGLARGYLGRPDLTAARFLPHAFGRQPGARLYATGDLARWGVRGELEFLGRIDHQVKVRGVRVELAEVEAVLRQHPDVREAVVLLREDLPGGRGLVAWVMAAPGWECREDDVRNFLRERLPQAMVPAVIAGLEALPLTPNGKLDRRALAQKPLLQPGPELLTGGAPRTPVEELLAGIFAELLGVPEVARRASFFDIGGHSLFAVQLASRVREALGVELPVREIFESPTVEGLAAAVERAQGKGTAVAQRLERVDRDGHLPLSFAQQRLWFLAQLEPESAAYNIPAAVRLEGRLDRRALAAALDGIVARHEALRTCFGAAAGQPLAVLVPPAPLPLSVVELAGLPAAVRDAEVRRLAHQQSRLPFNLTQWPLLRVLLVAVDGAVHVALFTLHHIAGDGWSLRLLLRELGALYRAVSEGVPSPLPELTCQYRDFAAWQRQWLTREAMERRLAFWRERLRGAPPFLTLPTDRPRPAVLGDRGASSAAVLPAALAGAVAGLARRQGATPFMLLAAAAAALLSRWTDQTDISLGVPVAGRSSSEVEPLIGLFVNTVVLRTDLAGDPELLELLASVRETALEAFLHQDLPFEKLVEELAPQRSLSHAPLFQVLFALQESASELLELPGLRLQPLSLGRTTAKFDLTWTVVRELGGLTVELGYNVQLFDAVTPRRLLRHLENLLTGAVRVPGLRLSDLPLLDASEQAQLLREWNDTAVEAIPGLLHEHVEARVRRSPDAVAVAFEGGALTYRELNRRANRLARRLRALGAGADRLVAVCAESSPATAVALLAILKSGGAYLPLESSLPRERLAWMLEDAGAPILLTEPGLLPLPHSGPMVILQLDAEIAAGSAADDEEDAAAGSLPESLAYVLYTSGSTGRPKGVEVSHSAICNRLLWSQAEYPLAATDCVLQLAALSFDFSVWEIFAPWISGARLVLPRPGAQRDDALVVRAIAEHQVTVAHFVPSLLQMVVETTGFAGCTSLRHVFCGGESLPGDLVGRFGARSGATLWNQYGPTEAAVDVTFWRCRAAAEPSGTPIGRPIANTCIRLLDRQRQPVPAGVEGEIYIGGANLARGYRGRPDWTAARFVPDPWSETQGARLYRTGDRARLLPDGRLLFTGRLDHQVKVRGFRIELGEIEAVLAEHPGVLEATVVLRKGEGEAADLTAHVVPAGADGLGADDLRTFARSRLPLYMVPTFFVLVDTLPRTPAGKVDRRSLEAGPPPSAPDGALAEPRTPLEGVLAETFAAVLRRSRVGLEEDFFALGGHSLLAMQLVSHLRDRLAVDLPVRAVFEAPTVASLARSLELLRGAGAGEPPPPVRPAGRTGHLPLSAAQQRVWFLDRMDPIGGQYNIAAGVRLRGALDHRALAHALSEVVRRHAVLRTSFRLRDGQPVQSAEAPRPLPLPLVDLSGLPAAARLPMAHRLLGAEARRPFDLTAPPLLRAHLLRMEERDHLLSLCLHHIAADGWSRSVLVRETAALYEAQSRGLPSPLPAPALQYADFACWQQSRLADPAMERQLAYWRERLRGPLPVLDLPRERPRAPQHRPEGAGRIVQLTPDLTDRLRSLARRERATLFMVLLAAFEALLARYSGQQDVIVGTPVAGRTRPELEGLIGCFLNSLALRTDLTGDPPFRQILAQVLRTSLDAFAHQEVPFERVLAALQPERDWSATPVFQVLFNLLNLPHEEVRLGDLAVEPVEVATAEAKLDLTVYAEDPPDRPVRLRWVYDRRLFSPLQIEAMCEHFVTILEAVTLDPGLRLAALPLRRSAAAAQRFPTRWEACEGSIGALFARRVAELPDRLAIETARHRWTYAELGRRVAHTALSLADAGSAPVALLCDHDAPMVQAVLGVLTAGQAYVPLDPRFPVEHLNAVLRDCRPAVLLAETARMGLAEELLAALPAGGRPVLRELEEPRRGAEVGLPETRGVPDRLAYLLYTSGSLGEPKGVMQSHRNVLHHIRTYAQALSIRPGDRLSLFSSFAFDAAVMDLFGALLHGATLCPLDVRREGGAGLGRWLAERRITIYHSTPTLYRHLCATLRGNEDLGDLRLVVLGGEETRGADLESFRRHFPATTVLVNGLGPTESTLALQLFGGHGTELSRPGVPVGWPVADTEVLLLNAAGEQVALYGIGEMAIRSHQIALGYWRRPVETARSFVPDPAGIGGRLYLTGDLGRLLADGGLEFAGRKDLQVKIRGHRVEVAEVEAALVRYPGIESAVVVARDDLPGGVQLVAYLVPRESALPPAAAELRSWLGRLLPDAMIPSVVSVLPALPLTPTGKVDRRALPRPELPSADLLGGFRPPETRLEKTIAGIVEEVLETGPVGRDHNFFDLGGTSLSGLRVLSRIEEALGVEVPVRTLFESPSIRGIAAVVANLRATPSAPAAPAVARSMALHAEEILGRLDDLSAQEIETLLSELQADGGGGAR